MTKKYSSIIKFAPEHDPTPRPLPFVISDKDFGQERPDTHSNIWEDVSLLLSDNGVKFERIVIDETSDRDYLKVLPEGKQEVHIYPLPRAYPYRQGYYSDKGGSFDKRYFCDTSIENEKKNIRTIWIKPWEWIKGSRMRNVLSSIMLNACGITGVNFNARNTEVREIPSDELRPFLEKNSFYGYRAASLSLGLYLTKEWDGYPVGTLLMLYTFGYPFFGAKNGKYDCEVIRAATLIGTNVRGGASKLFKHFVENYTYLTVGKGTSKERKVEWSKCAYYCEFDHTNGNSLPHLGFDFIEYSGPGFVNVDMETGEWSHRQPMKHKEVMEKIKNGTMYSVFNAGVKTFIYYKNKENIIKDNSDFTHE